MSSSEMNLWLAGNFFWTEHMAVTEGKDLDYMMHAP
jgi:hypothetical protein